LQTDGFFGLFGCLFGMRLISVGDVVKSVFKLAPVSFAMTQASFFRLKPVSTGASQAQPAQ
jgi:hypothetical protein